MSGGWFGRLRRLIWADAHAVLESLEERSLLLKQHLREAEIELGRKRASLETRREQARQLTDRLDERRERVAALDRDIEMALQSDDEALARFAIRNLLPLRQELETLERALATSERDRLELEAQLGEQEARFAQLSQRVEAELARPEIKPSGVGLDAERGVADEEVDLELLRRRTARAEMA